MKAKLELLKFLRPYDESIQQLVFELRKYILKLVPETNELIWDNYNAVAMAYSKSDQLKDAFCHIAVYAKHINLGFNRGSELSKRDLKLEGSGKLIRHLKVRSTEDFQKDSIEQIIYEAVGISERRNKNLANTETNRKSIVMSVSEKKIRPKN
ncbi:DUF1801 domain-containing protein [Maribacter halichondriae]|uniref:DUF1801 domain-containing protein n=1 Tax=Maribacter halichondriae TaxID=2980554 RepID=UPI00235A343D|nr:DUF1801 domain-containing protein [Maribacter sp. Hal144]